MANVEVKKSEIQPAAREWDPFRVMRELMRWDPFTSTRWPAFTQEMTFAPAFDVKETPEGFLFRADMPGVKNEDLDVKLADNRLIISGKREAEKKNEKDTYYTYERTYGSFTRTFTLPEGIDGEKVHAELKDGVFSLLLPRKPGAVPKQIKVNKT